MSGFWQDLRFAIRWLRKAPGFTMTAAVMLALGIGANTAIFSIVHAVLIRPLPFHNPEQLFVVSEDAGISGTTAGSASGPDFDDYRDQNRTFARIADLVPFFSYTYDSKDGPVLVNCTGVSPEFFPALGVKPLLGRLYEPWEYHIDGGNVVISYRFWQREFGGDPHILGRTIRSDQAMMTIIGVMPPLPDLFPNTDVWAKVVPDFPFMKWRNNKFLTVIGRLKPGVTPQEAEEDLSSILRRAPGASPSASVKLVPLKDYFVGPVKTPVRLLMAAVVLVLIITCANLANLLLARANARQQEIAIRLGLGATQRRVLQQFLTENWLLAMIGGVLGIQLASAGVRLLLNWSADNLPRGTTIAVDLPVLLFALGISTMTVLLFGWAPAAVLSKLDLNQTLRTGRSDLGPTSKRGLRGLVISEIAGSMVLLAGAGLLMRSFWEVSHVHPGFEPQYLLTAYLRHSDYGAEQQVFMRQVLERVAALPGVEHAALGDCIPGGSAAVAQLRFFDRPADPHRVPSSKGCFISSDFFPTVGARMVAGRPFNAFDTATSLPIVVVNQLFASRFWPGENPIGKRLAVGYTGPGRRALGAERVREVVGVVANIKHEGLDVPVEPALYMPYVQDETNHVLGSIDLFVRAQNPVLLAESVRKAIQRLRPNQPVARMQTLTQYLVRSLAPRRFNLLLFGAFAGLALLLATMGVYGVIAYSVSQRTREFGLRIALGAERVDLLRTVIREGIALALVGAVIGLVVAPGVLYLMRNMIFNVSPFDPLTYAAVALLFLAVTIFACAIPARKAFLLDPIRAIGSE
ncbi:MAG: ABC transporter permease [Acidobacteriaceae bacterium]|nr:ABC transporter permease [Acidobacteriaceae bacterium]MBV9501318.1 ABC transporter permease [Acidobacteriaceae bacterium]